MAPARWLEIFLARNSVVAVPLTVERTKDRPLCQAAGGKDRRHVLWRAGFIVGRRLLGIEVQQSTHCTGLPRFVSQRSTPGGSRYLGKGKGGMTALYAAAVDDGLNAAGIVDYFQQQENCWEEPIDLFCKGRLISFEMLRLQRLLLPGPFLLPQLPEVLYGLQTHKLSSGGSTRCYEGLLVSEKLVSIKIPDEALEAIALKLATLLGAGRTARPLAMTFRPVSGLIDESRNTHFRCSTLSWASSSFHPRDRCRRCRFSTRAGGRWFIACRQEVSAKGSRPRKVGKRRQPVSAGTAPPRPGKPDRFLNRSGQVRYRPRRNLAGAQ